MTVTTVTLTVITYRFLTWLSFYIVLFVGEMLMIESWFTWQCAHITVKPRFTGPLDIPGLKSFPKEQTLICVN